MTFRARHLSHEAQSPEDILDGEQGGEDGAGGQVYSSAPAMGVVEWRERAFTPWPLREIAFKLNALFFPTYSSVLCLPLKSIEGQ